MRKGNAIRSRCMSGKSWKPLVSRVFMALIVCAGTEGARAQPRLPGAPAPQHLAADDPIGALLAQQALENPQAALPVVIGLNLQEAP